MIKVLIVEDEPLAAKRLASLIVQTPGYEITKVTDSVTGTVGWLADAQPDLAFFDIQLADGLSFQIFDQAKLQCPVIFTTAFDEYALKAFKVNSIDYLLKPIDEQELEVAIAKFEKLRNAATPSDSLPDLTQLRKLVEDLSQVQYKENFIIRLGDHIKSLKIKDILYFVSEEKSTFAIDLTGKKHLLDSSLEEVLSVLNPKKFFRISRKYIVSEEAIKDIISFSNSRLKLSLQQNDDPMVIVSRERVAEFKHWLDR